VAQPDYRKLFKMLSCDEPAKPSIKLPIGRVHLAEDRAIFYSKPINSNSELENIKISLAFQREVINQIAPRVQPDLIHCHDWMTGLIPAAAREYEMPCLFTVQNAESAKNRLSDLEDRGIDVAAFWRRLFYDRFPGDYENTRDTNPLDFLLSGILAAHQVETASFLLLPNIVTGRSKIFYACLRQVLACKYSVNATRDKRRYYHNGPNDPLAGKQKNKRDMGRGAPAFNHCQTAYRYVDLYERILQRPLMTPEKKKARAINKDGHIKASDGQAVSYPKAWSTNSHVLYNKQIATPAIAPI
jgi:starch synthase/alpha-amylase